MVEKIDWWDLLLEQERREEEAASSHPGTTYVAIARHVREHIESIESKLDHYRDLTSIGLKLCSAPDWSNDGTPTRHELAKQFTEKFNEKEPA